MKSDQYQESRKRYLQWENILFGVLLSLTTALVLTYLDGTNYRIPNSPGIFATIIILIAFQFGLVAGLVAALVATIHTVIHFSEPGSIFFYPHEVDRARVLIWGVIFPMQGALIGILKERLLNKIDSEKVLQEKLFASSKLAATGEMAAGIAHEVNTPLTAMVLNAEMILLENESLQSPNEDIAKRAQTIIDIGHRISKIIDGLKGFSRDASNDANQLFPIRTLITSTLDLCRERFRNNNINVIINENDLDTLIDGQIIQLSQTLLNLLSNSFDAIQSLPDKWIKIDVAIVKQHVEMSVTDCGNGIDKDVLEKIFNPFFTTKDIGKGTGLGLSISMGIIQKHGGHLFYDKNCKNTRFVIQLPVATKQKE